MIFLLLLSITTSLFYGYNYANRIDSYVSKSESDIKSLTKTLITDLTIIDNLSASLTPIVHELTKGTNDTKDTKDTNDTDTKDTKGTDDKDSKSDDSDFGSEDSDSDSSDSSEDSEGSEDGSEGGAEDGEGAENGEGAEDEKVSNVFPMRKKTRNHHKKHANTQRRNLPGPLPQYE